MTTNNYDGLSKSQKIRVTLHRDVRSICTETCHFLGLEITKPAMEIIAELLFKKLTIYGSDLEAFAKHAKRTTINSEDVKLLVRRNPSLKQHLNSIAPAPSSTIKEKRRKTTLPAKDTPAKPSNDIRSSTVTKETSKPTDDDVTLNKVEETSRPHEVKEDPKLNEFEDMVIDDTIDLTFD